MSLQNYLDQKDSKIVSLQNDLDISKSKVVDFSSFTFDSTFEFSLKDKYIPARIVDIYDGDTVTAVINIFNSYFKFNVRLCDIDTCEMKSHDTEAKNLAYQSRNRLFEMVTEKQIKDTDKRKDVRKILNESVYMINLLCGEFDKYGRLLGWLYGSNNEIMDKQYSYNHLLVKERLAYIYKGDTKLTELEQINLLKL